MHPSIIRTLTTMTELTMVHMIISIITHITNNYIQHDASNYRLTTTNFRLHLRIPLVANFCAIILQNRVLLRYILCSVKCHSIFSNDFCNQHFVLKNQFVCFSNFSTDITLAEILFESVKLLSRFRNEDNYYNCLRCILRSAIMKILKSHYGLNNKKKTV